MVIKLLKDDLKINTEALFSLIPSLSFFMQDKFNSIKDISYKRKSLLGYLILNYILKTEFNITDKVDISKGRFLNLDSNLHFSISHSLNYIIVVVSTDEVGIDIEEKRNLSSKIKERLEVDSDIDALMKWTMFEAAFKLDNSINLDNFKENINFETIVNEKDNYIISLALKKK